MATSEKTINRYISAAQQGDEEAFKKLVNLFYPQIYKVISRTVKDKTEVNDVAQETFIKVYKNLKDFRGDSRFYTWLYRIAVNTAKNYNIYQMRHTPTTDIDYEIAQLTNRKILRDTDTPERNLMCDEALENLNKILEAMPKDLRTALILRDIERYSYERIAKVMQCPIGTVRSRIYRAREYVNQHLE